MAADKGTIFKNAQKYAAKGNHDKAIEEWKKLIKKTPNDGNIFNSIGDLYIKKKSIPEAVQVFLDAANTFEKAGFSLKTIAVYKKIIKIDPARFDVYLKLGDINANRGLVSNAVDDYLKAGKHFINLGKIREGVDVFRKITQLDPKNISIRIKLAEMCLKEGLKTEAIAEYLEIAEFYSQGGQKQKAIRACEQILKIDSNYSEAKILRGKLLGKPVEEPLSPAAADVKEEDPGLQVDQEGTKNSPETEVPEDLSVTSRDDSEESIDVPVLELTSLGNESPGLEIPDSATIDSEDDGLPSESSKADEFSDNALVNFKEESQVSSRDILKDPENKEDLILESEEIEDSHTEIVEKTKTESIESNTLFETSYPENEDSLSVDSLSTEGVFTEAESLQDQKVEGKNKVVSENKNLDGTMTFQTLSSDEIAERLSEGGFYLQQGLKEEAKKIYQLILSAEPDHTEARDRLMELEVEEDIEREISGLPDSKMFEEIDGAEHSATLGRSDPEYESTLSQTPQENSGVKADTSFDSSLNEMSLGNGTEENESTSTMEVETNKENEGFVNLSDFLEKELGKEADLHEISQSGTFNSEIDSVFKEFQKGIQEQFGNEDYETHYDLGIAYKEMGLLNEAISEFELSVKGKDRFIDSCNMLSICFMEKGENNQAIRYLVNALENPLCIGKNELWLQYELGTLYEREGLYEKAFQLLNHVKQEEGDFKEVNSKVENLRKLLRNQNSDDDSQFTGKSSGLELGNSRHHQSKPSKKKGKISYL